MRWNCFCHNQKECKSSDGYQATRHSLMYHTILQLKKIRTVLVQTLVRRQLLQDYNRQRHIVRLWKLDFQ